MGNEFSKKRKLQEISGGAQSVILSNPRDKIRRITQDDDYKTITLQVKAGDVKMTEPKKKILFTIKDLPWDILGIIMNYTPKG